MRYQIYKTITQIDGKSYYQQFIKHCTNLQSVLKQESSNSTNDEEEQVPLNFLALFNCYSHVKHISKIDPMIGNVLDILQQNHHEEFNNSDHPIHLSMFLPRNLRDYFGECLINFMDLYFELIIQLFICGNVEKAEELANQVLGEVEQISEESFLFLYPMLDDIYLFNIEYEDEFLTHKQKLVKSINMIMGMIYFNENNEFKYMQYMERVYSGNIERKMLKVTFLNRIEDFESAYEIVKELVNVNDFYKYIDEYCKTMIGLNRTDELFQVLQAIIKNKIQSNYGTDFVENNFGAIYCLYLAASLSGRLSEIDYLDTVESVPSFNSNLKILKCHKKFQICLSYEFLEQMKHRSSFVILNSYSLSMYDSKNQFMQPSKEVKKVIHNNQLKLFVNMYSLTSFRFQVDLDFSNMISNGSISTEFKYSYNPKNLSLIYDPENDPEREIYSDSNTKLFANTDSIYICKPDGCVALEIKRDYGSQIICYRNYLLLKKDFSIKSVSFDGKTKNLSLSGCRVVHVNTDREKWVCFLFDFENKNLIALGQDCEPSIIASSLYSVDVVNLGELENGIACYLAIEKLQAPERSTVCKYFINIENGNLYERKALFSTDGNLYIEFYNEKEKIIGFSSSKTLQIFNVNTNNSIFQMPIDACYLLDQFQDMALISSSRENRLVVLDCSEGSVKVLVDLSFKNEPPLVLGKFCGAAYFIIEREDTMLYEYSISKGECLAIYPFKIGFTTSMEYFEHSSSQKRFILVQELDCIHLIELSPSLDEVKSNTVE